MQETIDCVFRKYIFKDPRTGYTALRLKMDAGKYIIGTSNHCLVPPNLTEGCVVRVTGEMGQSRVKYFPFYDEPGFSFTNIEIILPPDIAHTVDYILGLEVSGIGPAVAETIARLTGPDLESFFTKHSDPKHLVRLVGKPAFRIESVENLIKKVFASNAIKELYDFLLPCGISYTSVFRLYSEISKVSHNVTINELKQVMNPTASIYNCGRKTLYDYCAAAEISFYEADQIGKFLGFSAYNSSRRKYVTQTVMQKLSAKGHTWSGLDVIYQAVKYVSAKSAFPNVTLSANVLFATLSDDPSYVREETDAGFRFYLRHDWEAERSIAYHIYRIKSSHRHLPYNEALIEKFEKQNNISLSLTQKQCFGFLRQTGLKIVTGNAGTGKTTVISSLLSVYFEMCPYGQVALCAPTGRAAKRMMELCKDYGEDTVNAYTIHKLLNYIPTDKDSAPAFNEENPLLADLIVVDEMSMVDVTVFSALMKAIKPGALVILCGDVDQLPSVQAGKVFSDIIASGIVETIHLKTNYRQGNRLNPIVVNAEKVNRGETNLMSGPEFDIVRCRNEAELLAKTVEIVKSNRATVLTTIHNGLVGTENINRILQPIVNQNRISGIVYNGTTYAIGDTVMMNRNNYDIGYVNGDIGIIISMESDRMIVQFGNESKTIEKECFSDMSLAYCMTVHKSQGSEYDNVVILLPAASGQMLSRNLLYTAITRARKKVTILSQNDAIAAAINNVKSSERRTSLRELLRGLLL